MLPPAGNGIKMSERGAGVVEESMRASGQMLRAGRGVVYTLHIADLENTEMERTLLLACLLKHLV